MDKLRGNPVYMFIGSAVSVAVTVLISRLMDQPVIGWAIGSAMMSASAGLFMMPRQKHWAVKTAVWHGRKRRHYGLARLLHRL